MEDKARDDTTEVAMNVIEDVLKIFQVFLDWDLNYSMPSVEMFLNHLQLMSQRVATKKVLNEIEDKDMYCHLSEMYERVSGCVDKVAQNLKDKYEFELSCTEKMYLIVHMQNILNTKKNVSF